jgi:hypothetical protein
MLACASQEATRRKVDEIVRLSIGEESQTRLRLGSVVEPPAFDAAAKGPAADPQGGYGYRKASRNGLDKAKGAGASLQLPWQEVAPTAQVQRTRGVTARSTESATPDERKDSGAAKSEPEPAGGLAKPTSLLLAIDVLESEADAIIVRLQKEAGIDATFASSLVVTGERRQGEFVGKFLEAEDKPAEGDLKREEQIDIDEQAKLPDAGDAAGKELQREQKTDEPVVEAGESGEGALDRKRDAREPQPPATGSEKGIGATAEGAIELVPQPRTNGEDSFGQTPAPAGADSPIGDSPDQQVGRRIRLVIRLILQSEPMEKSR